MGKNNKLDTQYIKDAELIKNAVVNSQLKAIKSINCEQLSLYYSIGRYVSAQTREGKWGTGAIEQISAILQREMPGLKGFSASNIKKMRIFYEQWKNLSNLSLPVNDFKESYITDNQIIEYSERLTSQNRSHSVNDFDRDKFFSLGFSLHYEILSKTETLDISP